MTEKARRVQSRLSADVDASEPAFANAAIVPPPSPVSELIPARSPEEFLQKSQRIATALDKLIKDRGLFKEIKGRRYIYAEAWTTCAAMLRCVPSIVDVKVDEDENREWFRAVATAVLRTFDGREISRAQAECSSDEELWSERDNFAIRSMAQTRAVSRVCRLALSWIPVLAGYEPTPAEEMLEEEGKQVTVVQSPPAAVGTSAPAPQPPASESSEVKSPAHLLASAPSDRTPPAFQTARFPYDGDAAANPATDKQKGLISMLLRQIGCETEADQKHLFVLVTGVQSRSHLSKPGASVLIEDLMAVRNGTKTLKWNSDGTVSIVSVTKEVSHGE